MHRLPYDDVPVRTIVALCLAGSLAILAGGVYTVGRLHEPRPRPRAMVTAIPVPVPVLIAPVEVATAAPVRPVGDEPRAPMRRAAHRAPGERKDATHAITRADDCHGDPLCGLD